MNRTLPEHGYIGCRKCYPSPVMYHEFQNEDGSKWCIEQPNAAWGAQKPRILVLGFSRGTNQSKPNIPFDEIAFKGMRVQLGKILEALDLLDSQQVDSRIKATESIFAFGSMIRCSVAQWDEKSSAYSKSGNSILQQFAKGDATRRIAEACSEQYLAVLPESTRLVVMLGNESRYVQFCYQLIKKVRGEGSWVNSMAYASRGVRFVHVIHAKAQGRHISDWLTSAGSQISKRRDATEAVTALGLSCRGLND